MPSIINWEELAGRGWVLLRDGLGISQWGGERLCEHHFLGFPFSLLLCYLPFPYVLF